MAKPTKAALLAELTNDPKALGYPALHAAGLSGDIDAYRKIAATLNATYAGVGTVQRTDLTAREILGCLVWSEVSVFTATQWAAFQSFLIPGTVDTTNTNVSALFLGLFPASTYPTTRANLTAVSRRVAPSRAEELWGAGTGIDERDVAAAYAP